MVLISGSAALDPKPGFAAVAAINAAIIALAKAFAEQGIKDGVQVNSVVPGAVMTGRRQSFFEKWAPAHNLTVEDAIKKFPEEAGISSLWKAGGDRRSAGLSGVPRGKVDDGRFGSYGRRRDQGNLGRTWIRNLASCPERIS